MTSSGESCDISNTQETQAVLSSPELSRKRARLQSKCGHLFWSRLFGNDVLAEKLTSHNSAIFEFDNLKEAARECAVRHALMQR